jgi:hypothetical protein
MLYILLFTDEAWYDLNGYINTQFNGICNAENPKGKQ